MKKIILLGAAPIRGEMRYPSEGSIEVSPDIAEDLIEVGLARADDLATRKVDEVRDIAERAGANVGPTATKAEMIDAINERRSNKA